jgi:hypothetical protein
MSYTWSILIKPSYLWNSVFTDFFFRYVLKESGQEHRLTPHNIFNEKYNFNLEHFEQEEILNNEISVNNERHIIDENEDVEDISI